MSRPGFSPRSIHDLDEILEYIARDNPDAAEQFISFLEEKCERLSHMPRIGARRDDLAEGLRASPVGHYVIYYRPTDEGVRIERVLHGARDAEALFDEN